MSTHVLCLGLVSSKLGNEGHEILQRGHGSRTQVVTQYLVTILRRDTGVLAHLRTPPQDLLRHDWHRQTSKPHLDDRCESVRVLNVALHNEEGILKIEFSYLRYLGKGDHVLKGVWVKRFTYTMSDECLKEACNAHCLRSGPQTCYMSCLSTKCQNACFLSLQSIL